MTENEQKIINKISDLSGDYKCYDNRINHEESLVLDRLLSENQQYRAIGTVEECRTAVERMKPKKVTYQGEHEKCPSCGSFHVFGKHCTECGQAVDYD